MIPTDRPHPHLLGVLVHACGLVTRNQPSAPWIAMEGERLSASAMKISDGSLGSRISGGSLGSRISGGCAPLAT